MKQIIGYIIFVSYNRNEYEMAEIALDDMTLKEFIKFADNDTINCKNVNITPIYDDTDFFVGGSEVNDDSVYWFVSARKAEEFKDFIKN